MNGYALTAFGEMNLCMKMETTYKTKRKFVEIEKEISSRLELLCFLKDIPQKEFVTKAVEKEIKPYDMWLERVRKLKTCNSRNYT